MDNPIQVDLGRIAQDLQIRRVQVESVVQFLDEGNTVPFITRYRKERTGNLNEVVIREIQLRVQRLRELAERKETILKAIEAQGKLDPDLAAAIRAADNPKRLEDLYLPFKPKKRTKASDARDKGLEPLALRIWNRDETLTDLSAAAPGIRQRREGVWIRPRRCSKASATSSPRPSARWPPSATPSARSSGRPARSSPPRPRFPRGRASNTATTSTIPSRLAQIPPHRVLAINRGDKEGPLKVRLEVARPELEAAFFAPAPARRPSPGRALPGRGHRRPRPADPAQHGARGPARPDRGRREARRRGLRHEPPQPAAPAADPQAGRAGHRPRVPDRLQGRRARPARQPARPGVIYPHPPQNRRSEAKIFLKDLVGKHKVGVVAIGNGTACRETEELIAEIIAEGTQFSQGDPAGRPATRRRSTVRTGPRPLSRRHTADARSPHRRLERSSSKAIAGRGRQLPSLRLEPTHPSADPGRVTAGSRRVSLRELRLSDRLPMLRHEAPDGTARTCSPKTNAALRSPAAGRSKPALPGPKPVSRSMPPISGDGGDSTAPTERVVRRLATSRAAPIGRNAGRAGTRSEHHRTPSAGRSHEAASSRISRRLRESEPGERAKPRPEAARPLEVRQFAAAARRSPLCRPELAADRLRSSSATEGADKRRRPRRAEVRAARRWPRPWPAHGEAVPARPAAAAGKTRLIAVPSQRPRNPPPARRRKHRPGRIRPTRCSPSSPTSSSTRPAPASTRPARSAARSSPTLDATLRGTISIGRRLQDPLSELVKIEPQNIGVGLYQHDVNPKQLKEYARVGHLELRQLRRRRPEHGQRPAAAARLGPQPVDRPADRRLPQGATGRSPAASSCSRSRGSARPRYTQAAGFLKIREGENPLDRTWIHPESYAVATRLLEKLGFAPDVVRDKDQLARAARQARRSRLRPSWPRARSRRVHPRATSSRPWPGPSATRATTCPSRSSRRAS